MVGVLSRQTTQVKMKTHSIVCVNWSESDSMTAFVHFICTSEALVFVWVLYFVMSVRPDVSASAFVTVLLHGSDI